jgi:RimJ/RimL family protein N-acetyltransferase
MRYNGYEIKNFTELSHEEVIQVLEARNAEHVRRWMIDKSPIKLSDHLYFLQKLKNTQEKRYYIEKKNNKLVGVYSLVGLKNGEGQSGFYLTDNAIKAELTIEFLYIVIDYLFRFGDVVKIFGFAVVNNKSANAINRLLGFREDFNLGIQRESGYIYTSLSKGRWINEYSKNIKLINMLRIIKGLNEN